MKTIFTGLLIAIAAGSSFILAFSLWGHSTAVGRMLPPISRTGLAALWVTFNISMVGIGAIRTKRGWGPQKMFAWGVILFITIIWGWAICVVELEAQIRDS